MPGDIADIITHSKFCVDLFRGFRVLTPTIFPFSIGLAGHPIISALASHRLMTSEVSAYVVYSRSGTVDKPTVVSAQKTDTVEATEQVEKTNKCVRRPSTIPFEVSVLTLFCRRLPVFKRCYYVTNLHKVNYAPCSIPC